MKQSKNIIFFSSGRADLGIFIKILKGLKIESAKIFLIVCNTDKKILIDKKKLNIKKIKLIHINNKISNLSSIAMNYTKVMNEMNRIIKSISPKLFIILGDRIESLAAASSSNIHQIPIVHFHGGEITLKSYDDYFRHSITKLSNLHLTSHESYRKRVVQMGESPKTVFNVGAPGLIGIKKELYKKEEIQKKLKIKIKKNFFVITYHPETLNLKNFEFNIKNLLDGIKLSIDNDSTFLFTAPGADVKSFIITKKIKLFCKKNANSFYRNSLGNKLYHSCLNISSGVIGNSSSGIIEAPSFRTWILNIGERQKGRYKPKSVSSIKCDSKMIFKKIKIFKKFKPKIANNPFYKRNCINLINKILNKKLNQKQLNIKKFYDL